MSNVGEVQVNPHVGPKFCSECGAPLESGARFCGSCGAKIFVPGQEEKHEEKYEPKQEPPKATALPAEVEATAVELTAKAEKAVAAVTEAVSSGEAMGKAGAKLEEMKQSSFVKNFKTEYLTTKGRLNRKAYWIKSLKLYGMLIVIGFVGTIGIGFMDARSGIANFLGLLMFLAVLPAGFVLWLGSVMVAVRRCHDLGRTGWILLIGAIPYVNFLLGIYIGFFKGTYGRNEYGEDPLMGL